MSELADFGLIGLAVMGENLALNVESRGFRIAGNNRTVEKIDQLISGRAAGKNFIGCHSREELVQSVAAPRKIMMLMPVMFTVMFLWAPSGLVVYWLTSNLLGIGQQLVTNRIAGPPRLRNVRPPADRQVKKAEPAVDGEKGRNGPERPAARPRKGSRRSRGRGKG